MSVYQPMDITCACGHTYSSKVVHGMNIDRLPEVREAILDGTFHKSACPSCGTRATLEKEFLYSDFRRNTFFKVKPRRTRHLWEQASLELEVDLKKVPSDLSEGSPAYRRVVFGLGELREKLVAQDAGMDDRLVELAKVFLVYEHPFLLRKPRLCIHLNEVNSQRLEFLAYHEHDKGAFRVSLPRGIFDQLAGRPDVVEDWVGGAHRRANFLHLENDHWVNFWRWSPQTTALRDLDRFAETARTGGEIDLESREFQRMLSYLPRGSHLPSWAKRSLRDVYDYAKARGGAEAIMDRIFEVRFDMGLDDDWAFNNDPDDIDTLWDLLRDLPDANVEGNTFISSMELIGGSGGWYDPNTYEIGIGSGLLWRREAFQDVVRHEVGHAVQEKRDRLQNGLVSEWLRDEFGWLMFGDSDTEIDAWVDLMGGYGGMTTREGEQVREMLRACLGRGGEWEPPTIPHVPADHPWRTKGFGPRLAFQQTGADWYENYHDWHRHGDRAFFVNFYYRSFMVVNVDTLNLIDGMPDAYAAMSPYEFFAELYALYYDLDDPKRENIREPVATWLRDNIGGPDDN